MQLMIASTNKNKIAEITRILQRELSIDLVFAPFFSNEEPDEPFTTFLENARHKAKYYGKINNIATLSEDTGLCIESLNQFPGVNTKDFIQYCGTFENAFIYLEEKMQPTITYSAQYICAIALFMPESNTILSYQAIEQGTISFPPRGWQGFGFDKIFIPAGQNLTIAQLGLHFKNRFCHRALAIKGLLGKLF